VSQYQKGKTNLDFTEARDSDWQWHQLGQMQVCTSLQTDNHASTPPLSGPTYAALYYQKSLYVSRTIIYVGASSTTLAKIHKKTAKA